MNLQNILILKNVQQQILHTDIQFFTEKSSINIDFHTYLNLLFGHQAS